MQDWGKPRGPGRERSRPPPRDPRADSDPPATTEETPLQSRPSAERAEALQRATRPPSSRPRADAASRIAALEADVERLTSERAHDADQIGEMLVRIAAAERARASAEGRASTSDQLASALRAEVANLEARCAQLEADAWEVQESTRRVSPSPADSARDALSRLTTIVDELERREEMAAGLRARTMEQLRQAVAELDAPPSPPVIPTPVIDIRPLREKMVEPDPFPSE